MEELPRITLVGDIAYIPPSDATQAIEDALISMGARFVARSDPYALGSISIQSTNRDIARPYWTIRIIGTDSSIEFTTISEPDADAIVSYMNRFDGLVHEIVVRYWELDDIGSVAIWEGWGVFSPAIPHNLPSSLCIGRRVAPRYVSDTLHEVARISGYKLYGLLVDMYLRPWLEDEYMPMETLAELAFGEWDVQHMDGEYFARAFIAGEFQEDYPDCTRLGDIVCRLDKEIEFGTITANRWQWHRFDDNPQYDEQSLKLIRRK